MNKIVNDVEYYTFPITIPIYKIKPPRNFQKYYQTHKDEIIVDLQKKNKTLQQELQRKDNIINELMEDIPCLLEIIKRNEKDIKVYQDEWIAVRSIEYKIEEGKDE